MRACVTWCSGWFAVTVWLCFGQDVVTRGGKLVFLYSRPGQRVLINGLGDMIVRPSWVEASLRRVAMGKTQY